MTDVDLRPIGLFDSGIGGLTVLKTLLHAFPNESFVYLGDTARLPYGSKSLDTIRRYLKQNIAFLLREDVKAIVVACNSASTVVLENSDDFTVPIYNVIEPGAALAAQASVKKTIGVLGTKATVASRAYVNTLHKIDPRLTVYQQACPLLVPLVEEGWDADPLTNLVIYRYVQPLVRAGVDTLILGCTHYPVLQEGFLRVVGNSITLIESGRGVVESLNRDFADLRLRPGEVPSPNDDSAADAKNPNAGMGARRMRVLTTDASPTFQEIANRLMAPSSVPAFEVVDITNQR